LQMMKDIHASLILEDINTKLHFQKYHKSKIMKNVLINIIFL